MLRGEWGHALRLSALAALAAVAGLICLTAAIVLGADPHSRPDDGLDWFLYSYVLLPVAVVVCGLGLLISARLYRRAFGLYARGSRRLDRGRRP